MTKGREAEPRESSATYSIRWCTLDVRAGGLQVLQGQRYSTARDYKHQRGDKGTTETCSHGSQCGEVSC